MQWCFAPGTKVWMQDGGVKNIEDIKANDVVLNGEGGFGKVIETILHYHSGDIYKIWTWGSSEPIICSEEHPLLSVLRDDATCSFRDKTDQARFNGKFIGKKCYFGSVDICRDNKCLTCNYNPEYREAGNLKVGDYLVTNPFGESATADMSLARSTIAGFYAAEGWIEKSGRVSIANTNPDFINKLETAFIALGVEYNVNAGKDGVFRVFTFDKNLRSYLEENVGCGASGKRVPSDIVHSIEHGKEFIKAYMAGDGHTPDEGEARYFTVSEQLAWQLKALYETCGCPVSLVKIEKFDAGHYGKKPIFRGRIQWSDWQNKILDGEVRGFGRARRTFYDESKKAILRKIKKIEIKNYDGMLYNLEVEDSHTYTANGFSVHNCRFYDTFHPLVGNAIDLHTQMPLSRFVLKGIKDKKVLRFFEQTLEQMDAFMLMYSQLREYWLIGENFTYLNWDEDMGTFTDGELLQPEYVEVRGHPFVRGETEGSYAYFLIPDEGIRAFINSPDESCQELKGKIPMEIRQAVEEEKNIRISNFNLMVLMRKQARYNPRGTSIILRCFRKGTGVKMPDGTSKTIESLKIGDMVWTHKGHLRPVIDTIKTKHSGEMISVYTHISDTPTVMTDNHDCLVWESGAYCAECGSKLSFEQKKRGQKTCSRSCNAKNVSIFIKNKTALRTESLVRKPAGELEVGDYLVIPRQTEFCQTEVTEGQARLLGYFLAEGCYQKRDSKVGLVFSFGLHEMNTWVADAVSLMKNEFDVECSISDNGKNSAIVNTLRRDANSEVDKLVSWMLEHAGEYSDRKRVSSDVLQWPVKLQEQVLIGFCRGDGSLSVPPELTCCTVSKDLIQQLSHMAWNLGLPHREYQPKKKEDRKQAYWLLFPGSINKKFIDKVAGVESEEAVNLVVDRIRELRAEGMTYLKIAEKLNDEDIKKTRGTCDWSAIEARNIDASGKYDIAGKGKHTHLDSVEGYSLVPITKIERENVVDENVYCVTVEEDHSIALDDSICQGQCLKDLLYEDKLREAQYAIADRHVLPKEIWKIGNEKFLPNKSKMKAFRDLIRDAEDQPKFTLVTHYAVNYEIQGATGKFPQLNTEFEWVENRILTALFTNKSLTHGEGPTYANACYCQDTEILTENGFKKYDAVVDGEKLATYNEATDKVEYQPFSNRCVYDYSEEMVHFTSSKHDVDILVTPNHRMLTGNPGEKDIKWSVVEAKDVKGDISFKGLVNDLKSPVTMTCDEMERVQYSGKVWCFEVPNGFLITSRNGRIAIQGNSIATRAMMMRYIPVRSQLEDVWKTKVFLPIAIEHGFYKITEAELSHKVRTRKSERELTIPEFDWRWKSNLLDDQNVRDMIKGMVGEGQLPMKTLIDMLGMDYDSILEWRKREEGTVFDPLYTELRKAAQKEGMEVSKGASVNKSAINRRLTEMRTATKQLKNVESKIDKPREFDFLSRGGLTRKIKSASMLLHKGEADVVKFLLGTGKDNVITLTSKTNEEDAKKYIENMKRDRLESL
jgi:intein/homing endonuclease